MSYFKVVKVFNSRLNKKPLAIYICKSNALFYLLGNRILTQYSNKTKPVKGHTWKREKVIDTSNFLLAYQYLLFHSFQESIWCLTGIVILYLCLRMVTLLTTLQFRNTFQCCFDSLISV